MRRPINVLLLLSANQQPHPVEEVEFLAREASTEREIHLATSRRVIGLEPGTSRVALYGDKTLGYRLLALATYEGFIPYRTQEGTEIRDTQALYSRARPLTIRGFLRLSRFALPDSPNITSLDGIQATGIRLDPTVVEDPMPEEGGPFDREWLSEYGNDNTSIYYVECGSPPIPLSHEEATRLWQCKCEELRDKCGQLADRWHDTQWNHEALLDEHEALEDRHAKVYARQKNTQADRERLQIAV